MGKVLALVLVATIVVAVPVAAQRSDADQRHIMIMDEIIIVLVQHTL